MKSLIILCLLATGSALASTNGYSLKMNLSINGKHILSPIVIVKAGEIATVSQKTDTEENFIEVIATENKDQNQNSIMMKFTIVVINQNGERTILSRPQIIAKENEKAEVSISEKEGEPELLSLSVIAERKTL